MILSLLIFAFITIFLLVNFYSAVLVRINIGFNYNRTFLFHSHHTVFTYMLHNIFGTVLQFFQKSVVVMLSMLRRSKYGQRFAAAKLS